jgi:hypothetical protein
LDAAQRTSDLDLQHRVLHDQFQENVQYHSICITKYLFKKNTKVEKVSDTESSKNELAFNNLIFVIHEDLMFNKKAFLMSFLLETFCSFLPPYSLNYSTSRLQSRLEKYYDESIVIQTQQGQGQSNIVFSSSVSIGDA